MSDCKHSHLEKENGKDFLTCKKCDKKMAITDLVFWAHDLQARIEVLTTALESARERFTNPRFDCVWKDAADDITVTLKDTTK